MTTKKPPKGMSEPEAEYRPESDEISDEQIDRWLERNAAAINASCVEAEAQIARGECFTLEEVMAQLKEQAMHRRARKA